MGPSTPISDLQGMWPRPVNQFSYTTNATTITQPDGVWFVYGGHTGPAYPLAVFRDADGMAIWLQANPTIACRVRFWKLGTEWSDE
jgi:hypothetical protein